ncbi:MAG TPA: YtxH domain-containing protein [Syntrophomonadaceae bacterium]|nr:YtxH domain-containing protein [Syntrophomonadaceae bacterium]
MILRDLRDLVSKEKRKKARVKAVRKFAIGMGAAAAVGVAAGILFAPKSGKETREDLKNGAVNTVGTIKDAVQKKAETVKDSATHTAQEVCNVIKDVHEKTDGIKKHIKEGCHDITQDINKTSEDISNELDKSVK